MKTKTKRYFLLAYTVLVGLFVTCVLPFFPPALVWGWMPNYLLVYIGVLLLSSVVWGGFMGSFLKTQPD